MFACEWKGLTVKVFRRQYEQLQTLPALPFVDCVGLVGVCATTATAQATIGGVISALPPLAGWARATKWPQHAITLGSS